MPFPSLRTITRPTEAWREIRKRLDMFRSRMSARGAFRRLSRMDIDPRSHWYSPEFVATNGGFHPANVAGPRTIFDLEPWDGTRRDMIVLLLRTVIERGVQGDLAELGVYRGITARLIHHYIPERRLHLFDTFSGFTERGAADELAATGSKVSDRHFADTSIEAVRRLVAARNDNVVLIPGFFPESVPASLSERKFAFVHLDADLYEPILAGLRYFYPRMDRGGIILVHDYNAWAGARRAVDAFAKETGILPIPMPDKSGSAVIQHD
jgi:O-methyltransferase